MMQCNVEMDQDGIVSQFINERLYGDEEVYIRELLQNAIDACNVRAALEWSWGTEFLEMEEAKALNSMRQNFQPKITLSYSSMTQRLTFEDNGIGINGSDIEKYVSIIGCSYYQSEEYAEQQLDYEPIGQFGIGMLSSFTVARALLIESRKDKSVNTAWNITLPESLAPITAKWIESDKTIEYINSNKTDSGTRVTLVLRPKYAMRLTLQKMTNAIRHYMLYQPFPIVVSYDSKSVTLSEPNRIFEDPYADVLGIISIPLRDEVFEGYIWIYTQRNAYRMCTSQLYQRGFLVAEGDRVPQIQPEWIQYMSYRINLKQNFLTLRLSRDSVADDDKLRQFRGMVGQLILSHFEGNPLGLNQYISSGQQPILTEYEEEMQFLTKAVTVCVYLKGREIELPIETIIQGFAGKVIRIAFISKALFGYYRANYFSDFRRFLKENRLIVFEKNRDIFYQMLVPYRKSHRYVISEYPGIIYDDMVADFHMIRSVVPFRHLCSRRPTKVGYDDIFCIVTNENSDRLELLVNEEHRISRLLAPVRYHPKVHNIVSVILENIKQRILNPQNRWDKVVDFGGTFVDGWNSGDVATVQSVWCLESDFAVSVNEFIESRLTPKERTALGLVGFEFHKEDFINWWYMPRE